MSSAQIFQKVPLLPEARSRLIGQTVEAACATDGGTAAIIAKEAAPTVGSLAARRKLIFDRAIWRPRRSGVRNQFSQAAVTMNG
jgi:hypothetical protein